MTVFFLIEEIILCLLLFFFKFLYEIRILQEIQNSSLFLSSLK